MSRGWLRLFVRFVRFVVNSWTPSPRLCASDKVLGPAFAAKSGMGAPHSSVFFVANQTA
jgi:hypothetical protein